MRSMPHDALSPVEFPEAFAEKDAAPMRGTGLCLSGGGYRAMLFHAGVLWRLNELGYIRKLDRISSVSGGSITSAVLGLVWARLSWSGDVATNFPDLVIGPIQRLAGETIDVKSVLSGIFLPRVSINDQIVRAYRKFLYGDATLQDLPAEGTGPRFVFNATSVQTGSIMRFSRPYMADWQVGELKNPTISLAVAVAASSAFPPVLSPARVKLPPGAMRDMKGTRLHRPPFTTDIVLTDGGVYDNLGLETVWKTHRTVIVSDGGGQMAPSADPRSDWAQHSLRINGLMDNQVRALRKRQVVGSLERKERDGVYWRMRGDIASYKVNDCLRCPADRTLALAETPTRLAKLDATLQQRIINWGYAICDAGMRAWVVKDAKAPADFPFPGVRV